MGKKLTAQEVAILRMAMHDETASLRRDMANGSADYMSEYPRMMYRQTSEEEVFVMTTHDDGRPRETHVLNRFDGLLCETTQVESADEMEAFAELGWDVSPKAAHGIVAGAVAVVTAKDDEIAALRAQIAAMQGGDAEADEAGKPRRGRPPKTLSEPA